MPTFISLYKPSSSSHQVLSRRFMNTKFVLKVGGEESSRGSSSGRGECLPEIEALADGDRDAEADGDAEAEADSLPDTDTDCDCVPEALADAGKDSKKNSWTKDNEIKKEQIKLSSSAIKSSLPFCNFPERFTASVFFEIYNFCNIVIITHLT